MLGYCLIGGACFALYNLTSDIRKRYTMIKAIKENWDELITKELGIEENKIFSMDNIEIDEDGFTSDICFIGGKNLNHLKYLTPGIKTIYEGNVRFELDKAKSSAKMYFKFSHANLSDEDAILFDWEDIFLDKKNTINTNGETFNITHIEPIKSYVNNGIIGYKLFIKIPIGLTYSTLELYKEHIDKALGKSEMQWDDDNGQAIVSILTNIMQDNMNYAPIKVNPYEIFIGLDKTLKPIIMNFRKMANAIVGGIPNTGKTNSIVMGIMNACICNNKNSLNLHIHSYTPKCDFAIFKNIKHCVDYSTSLEQCVKSLKELYNEHEIRNKLFNNCYKRATNIYRYMEITGEKLPIKILVVDEFANYSVSDTDDKKTKDLKKEYNKYITLLAREARNSGIYIILACQRAGEETMPIELRSYLGNKICFKQNYQSTAYTILGDEEIAKQTKTLDMNNREFICETIDGIKLGNSAYITDDIIESHLKPLHKKKKSKWEKKHPKNKKVI